MFPQPSDDASDIESDHVMSLCHHLPIQCVLDAKPWISPRDPNTNNLMSKDRPQNMIRITANPSHIAANWTMILKCVFGEQKAQVNEEEIAQSEVLLGVPIAITSDGSAFVAQGSGWQSHALFIVEPNRHLRLLHWEDNRRQLSPIVVVASWIFGNANAKERS